MRARITSLVAAHLLIMALGRRGIPTKRLYQPNQILKTEPTAQKVHHSRGWVRRLELPQAVPRTHSASIRRLLTSSPLPSEEVPTNQESRSWNRQQPLRPISNP